MNFTRKNFLKSATLLAAFSFSDIDAMARLRRITTGGGDVSSSDDKYWDDIRQLFPLDKKKVYLNNGTLGPSPYPTIEATHKGMMLADEKGEYHNVKKAIEKIAQFIGAQKKEIAITHNVTEGINIACWGMPIGKRDEVIMTNHEHVGNALPWLNRMKQDGVVIKSFDPAPTAAETLERIEALISRRTRVIAVPHIPCTQGQVLPVRDICSLAKDNEIYSFIDGAHGPGMIPVDVKNIGCDVYASCGHKWMLGPKGTGFLYVNADFQDKLTPKFVGSGSANWEISNRRIEIEPYEKNAHRYFGGTQNSGLLDGMVASVDFMERIGVQNVYNRVEYLGQYAQEQLLSFGNRIELLTPTEDKSYCGINSFRIKGIDNKEFFTNCHKKAVRVRYVPESNLNCIRVSTHIYNNKADVDALIREIKLVV